MFTSSKTSPDSSSLLAPSQLGVITLLLLALAALLLFLVPRHEFYNLTGDWFTVGWPFPTGSLKVGFVSAESPSGIHPHLHPLALLNAALWLGVFFGVRRAARIASFPRTVARAVVIFAFLASAVWFTFGAFSIVTALSNNQ